MVLFVRLQAISGTDIQPHYGFESYKSNGTTAGNHSNNFSSEAVNSRQNNWRHIGIYVNKNIGKLYIDQHRLAVLNQVEAENIDYVEIEVYSNEEHPVIFKNFRIASGGDDAYNKIDTDGKFIAYGIQFDVNKATLKPESMGTINEFIKMMKANPELKFEIGGHTDSDGTNQRNKTPSQERAEAVKNIMASQGIENNRLTTKGYGSSKPITENNNAENKARNRRVEFTKI